MATRHSRKTSGSGKNDLSAAQGKVEAPQAGNSETHLSEDERRRMVAEAAYYRAEQRGFSAGGEVDDWLTAEREISQRLQSIDTTRRSGTTGTTGTTMGVVARPDGARMETRTA
ncbi:hypothetical protein D3C83_46550 [compost metagenome]